MANRDSTTTEPASTTGNKPFHEDFSWLHDNVRNDVNAEFAATVKTISRGCITIGSIAQMNMLDIENSRRPLLGGDDMDSLMQLLVSSLGMLRDVAENRIDYMEAAVQKGGAK